MRLLLVRARRQGLGYRTLNIWKVSRSTVYRYARQCVARNRDLELNEELPLRGKQAARAAKPANGRELNANHIG